MTLEQNFSRVSQYFSASHFLIGYDKCDRLHGHNYRVKLRIRYTSSKNNEVIDFRVINSILKSVLNKLEHKILLPGNSKEIRINSSKNSRNWDIILSEKFYSFPKEDTLILYDLSQTTTESLAIYIHSSIKNEIHDKEFLQNIQDLTVTLSETKGNEAKFTSKLR